MYTKGPTTDHPMLSRWRHFGADLANTTWRITPASFSWGEIHKTASKAIFSDCVPGKDVLSL